MFYMFAKKAENIFISNSNTSGICFLLHSSDWDKATFFIIENIEQEMMEIVFHFVSDCGQGLKKFQAKICIDP